MCSLLGLLLVYSLLYAEFFLKLEIYAAFSSSHEIWSLSTSFWCSKHNILSTVARVKSYYVALQQVWFSPVDVVERCSSSVTQNFRAFFTGFPCVLHISLISSLWRQRLFLFESLCVSVRMSRFPLINVLRTFDFDFLEKRFQILVSRPTWRFFGSEKSFQRNNR